jgi:hypothetical protein
MKVVAVVVMVDEVFDILPKFVIRLLKMISMPARDENDTDDDRSRHDGITSSTIALTLILLQQ